MIFLYREMLEELEFMKTAGSAEDFASEVLDILEKEAWFGAVARPIAGAVAKGVGKIVAPVHKAQMNLLKETVKTPAGAALTAGTTVLVGPKVMAEGLFPMLPAAKNAFKQVSTDLSAYNKVTLAGELADFMEKVAVDKKDTSISFDDIQGELDELERINFRDDRISINDFVRESTKNLGSDNRDRVMNVLRAQRNILGEVGYKIPFETLEELVSEEKYYNDLTPEQAAEARAKFMSTGIVYNNHPVFGTVVQPRSSYNKWYRDRDPDALFENITIFSGKELKNNKRSIVDKLTGRNKTISREAAKDNYKKFITTNYTPKHAIYTGGTFLNYEKWHNEAAALRAQQGKQADNISMLIEKLAYNTDPVGENTLNVKNIINAAGASLLGGGLGYGLTTKAIDFIDNSAASKNIDRGISKTVGDVGKGAARAFTRNRPVTDMVSNIMTNTSRFMDTLGGGKKVRIDYSKLTDTPSASHMSKTLGKYLAILAGASLAEEYLANWGRNKIDSAIVNYKMNNIAENDRLAELIENVVLEKVANTTSVVDEPVRYKDFKRLLFERSVKPAITTGTFLFTLGGLSSLTGRNLYGGMERVEKDEYRPANRVIIDIADPDAAKKYFDARPHKKAEDAVFTLIEKVADGFDTINMHRLDQEAEDAAKTVANDDWKPETKLDKAKAKIDEKAAKGPKFIRKFDNFLANADSYKYKGRTGLGHWLLEEVPFKSVESLAYAAPMIATAVLLNRNAKRGFAPLQDDPNTPYVPDGMTRVIIQESGYKDKEGNVVYNKPKDYTKYASENLLLDKTELDAIREVIETLTLEEDEKRQVHALKYINKEDGVVNGVKKKQRMVL